MRRLRPYLPLAVALAVIVGTILAIERPWQSGKASTDVAGAPVVVPGPQGQGADPLAPSLATPRSGRKPASGPQAAQVEGISAWINSQPLTIQALRGQVVLVDFWTYTCVNCIRTFPYLKLWHARYADDGLVILGVHTPEFEFEKDLDNVVRATRDNGILWPVALDNDFTTWENYSNRYWPAKYLVDQDGVVRYTHFGEGEYAATEKKIRELLVEAGADLSDDPLALPSDQPVDPVYLTTRNGEITRETYAGYERNRGDSFLGRGGYVGQRDSYYENTDKVAAFVIPQELSPHQLYFQGPWFIGPESVRHAQKTEGYPDYLALVYSAKSVNAVLTADDDAPYRVRVTVGGKYLTQANKGRDVTIGPDGESYVMVTGSRLYQIVDHPSYFPRQRLEMSSTSDNFGLFAFTFGIYSEGP
ncbi:MAG: redoxin domain-containing protein [Dehalococcoidia bacterium]|nr:redoxin domain-containing protein [Dehalococcoidia bacterium]MSQ16680.1 redoxin domain-containing protein [Dehalococcoidia bacterium]